MNSSKKYKIIMIILSIIIVSAIIAGIVLYFTTDIFKSNESLFQRYFAQDIELVNKFIDVSPETEYRKTLENNNFDENTLIQLDYTNNEGNQETVTGNIKGVNNNSANLAYKDLIIKSGDTNITEIEYLKENQIYGLHFADIVEKFATIDFSNNITTIMKYFGIENIVNTDKINMINLSELFNLTEEEKDKILNNYMSIILSNINKKDYSSSGEEIITLSNNQSVTTKSYVLTLDSKQLTHIYVDVLDNLTKDEIILGKIENIDSKLKEIGINLNKDLKTQFIDLINKNINSLKIEKELVVTLYEVEETTVRTVFEYGDRLIQIDLDTSNQNHIIIKYSDISSEQPKDKIISINKTKDTIQINYENFNNEKVDITRTLQQNASNIKSNIEVVYTNTENVKVADLKLERDINIGTNTEIPTSFEKEGKILLNDYDDASLKNLFDILKEKIIDKLKQKRNETNSILLNYIIDYNNQLEENQRVEEENAKNRFNSKFQLYEGKNVEKSVVMNMLDEAGKNMTKYQMIGNNQIKLYIEEGKENNELATEIKNKLSEVDQSVQYNIVIGYDKNKLIKEITIQVVEPNY